MIDFPTLLRKNSVAFITSGANVAKGNINIHCPFCGSADPSYHLGIRLSDGAWGCWREPSHRGRRPHRLLRKLFGWSVLRIQSEISIDRNQPLFSTTGQPTKKRFEKVVMPDNFRPLRFERGQLLYCNYLIDHRGYDTSEINEMSQKYDLRVALSGEWEGRIIIPVYDHEGRLQTWVGRAVKNNLSRYKACTNDETVPIKESLWISPDWDRSQVLVLTEGPFDAITVDLRGQSVGLSAACIFGAELSQRQESLLRAYASCFDLVVIALDRENLAGTLGLTKRLVGFRVMPMGMDTKDPGDMTKDELVEWGMEITNRASLPIV